MNQKVKRMVDNRLMRSESFRQMVKYGMVGVVGLGIDMGLYYLLVTKFAVHYSFSPFISSLLAGQMSIGMIDILISNVISTSLAVVNNFFLNSYFTFHVTNDKLKRFMTFAGIATIGLVISSMLLTLMIGVMDMNEMVAKAISVLLVAAMQFVINKLFTFKHKPEGN